MCAAFSPVVSECEHGANAGTVAHRSGPHLGRGGGAVPFAALYVYTHASEIFDPQKLFTLPPIFSTPKKELKCPVTPPSETESNTPAGPARDSAKVPP